MQNRVALSALILFFLVLPPAKAYDFAPLPPLNVKEVDPAFVKDMYGVWIIADQRGRKKCRVTLKKENTIGGSQLDFAKDCAKTFPVLGEITAWRLMEGFAIDLVDALRKTRIRFTTPDNDYVASPETDGIFTIRKN